MPSYPGGETEKAAYDLKTKGEKLVMDYLNISIFDVHEMPIDLYLFFMREAYIYGTMKTKESREYLENCRRMEQTKPDRQKIRRKIQEQREG